MLSNFLLNIFISRILLCQLSVFNVNIFVNINYLLFFNQLTTYDKDIRHEKSGKFCVMSSIFVMRFQ